jgi:DNA-binding response OmpR family regulator
MNEVDLYRRTVTGWGGKVIRLSRRQFQIVAHLSRRPGIVASRAQLLEVIEAGPDVSDLSISSLVQRMRRRGITAIQTHREFGYFWQE